MSAIARSDGPSGLEGSPILAQLMAVSGVVVLVLMDLRFGRATHESKVMDGTDGVRAIRQTDGPPVLIVTTYGSDPEVLGALAAGAVGYVLKDSSTDELLTAIRAGVHGDRFLGTGVRGRLRLLGHAPKAFWRSEFNLSVDVPRRGSRDDLSRSYALSKKEKQMRATATRLSFWAASVYLALGLLSGLFTREFTRGGEFESFSSTQLGTTHTHMLVLGFIMMLIVLLLDRTLGLTSKLFVWFFWIYNLGVMVTWGAMMTRGISTVQGGDLGAALSGIAGLGHILLSIALVMLMVLVGKRITASDKAA